MIGNLTRNFREASRGLAALTGIAWVGVAVDGGYSGESSLDDPILEMAAVEPIYYFYSTVYLQYTNTLYEIHTENNFLPYYPAYN